MNSFNLQGDQDAKACKAYHFDQNGTVNLSRVTNPLFYTGDEALIPRKKNVRKAKRYANSCYRESGSIWAQSAQRRTRHFNPQAVKAVYRFFSPARIHEFRVDTLVKRLFPSEQVAMMATGAGRELSKRMQADRVTEQTMLVCISTKSAGKKLSTSR